MLESFGLHLFFGALGGLAAGTILWLAVRSEREHREAKAPVFEDIYASHSGSLSGSFRRSAQGENIIRHFHTYRYQLHGTDRGQSGRLFFRSLKSCQLVVAPGDATGLGPLESPVRIIDVHHLRPIDISSELGSHGRTRQRTPVYNRVVNLRREEANQYAQI